MDLGRLGPTLGVGAVIAFAFMIVAAAVWTATPHDNGLVGISVVVGALDGI